jgi:hypothetical protein
MQHRHAAGNDTEDVLSWLAVMAPAVARVQRGEGSSDESVRVAAALQIKRGC